MLCYLKSKMLYVVIKLRRNLDFFEYWALVTRYLVTEFF